MWELRVEGRLLDESALLPQNSGASFNTSVSSIPALGRSGGSFSSSASSSANTVPPPLTAVQRGTSTGANTTSFVHQKRKFSSFFKSLVIELDKNIYGPDNHLVEWHRTPQTGETDGFQVIKKKFLFKIFIGKASRKYGCQMHNSFASRSSTYEI